MRHGLRRRERVTQLAMDGAGRPQGQRRGQIPQQLMKLPHDREHLIHLDCGLRVPAPVPPAEGDLGNLLARAEAVIHGASAEALLPGDRCECGTGSPAADGDRDARQACRSRNRPTPRTPARHSTARNSARSRPGAAMRALGGKPGRAGFVAQGWPPGRVVPLRCQATAWTTGAWRAGRATVRIGPLRPPAAVAARSGPGHEVVCSGDRPHAVVRRGPGGPRGGRRPGRRGAAERRASS